MPQLFIEIRGVDPLLFRDGRPFTTDAGGLTACSLPMPLPTTVAAFVRSQIGVAMGWSWDHEQCRAAHAIPVHGPLLTRDGQCVLPAPRDAVLTSEAVPVPLLPTAYPAGAGTDLPEGLSPLTINGKLPDGSDERTAVTGKPPRGYNYWTRDALLSWLEGVSPGVLIRVGGLPEEERIGIAMDAALGKAQEGMLYATRLRAFGERTDDGRHEYSLIARVSLPENHRFATAGTLGGERRLTVLAEAADICDTWPRCPKSLRPKLANATRVRMVLATPAHFRDGWKPGWLENSGSGAAHLPAGIAKVKLRLVAAATERRVAVSGWGLREEGPRPIRWLVPAGAVYFFEVIGGNPAALYEDAWMKPMSDNEQARQDGLGLALWGVW